LKNSRARIAALAFVSLFSFVSGSAAGTNTLNYPYGPAVDGKRNLYAATTTRSLCTTPAMCWSLPRPSTARTG
jgi:hypothetical protein